MLRRNYRDLRFCPRFLECLCSEDRWHNLEDYVIVRRLLFIGCQYSLFVELWHCPIWRPWWTIIRSLHWIRIRVYWIYRRVSDTFSRSLSWFSLKWECFRDNSNSQYILDLEPSIGVVYDISTVFLLDDKACPNSWESRRKEHFLLTNLISLNYNLLCKNESMNESHPNLFCRRFLLHFHPSDYFPLKRMNSMILSQNLLYLKYIWHRFIVRDQMGMIGGRFYIISSPLKILEEISFSLIFRRRHFEILDRSDLWWSIRSQNGWDSVNILRRDCLSIHILIIVSV